MSETKGFKLKQLAVHLRPFKKGIIAAWALLLATILMQLPMPLLTMYLIDNVVANKNVAMLNILCLGLFLFLFIQAFTSFFQKKIIINIQNKVVTNIRSALYQGIIKSLLKYFDKVKSGDLVSRLTSDVSKLQGLLAETIVSILTDGLTLLVGAAVLFWLHWKLALVSLAIVPLYIFSIKFFSKRIRNASAVVQKELAELTGALFESFIGIYFIKAFGTEDLEIKRTNGALSRVLTVKTKLDNTNAISGIIAGFVGAIGRFVLIWYGLSEIITGNLSIGGFLAFNSFLRYIYDPSRNLMNLNSQMQQSFASLERVQEVFDDTQNHVLRDGAVDTGIKGKVTFKDVSFAYDSERGATLQDISFTAEPNSVVAVVGPNGAGKTTMMNLLLRLYEPDSGVIEVDDVPLSQFSDRTLRDQISVVPQDIYLLSHTIGYNIAYGGSAKSEQEVIDAAKMAEAHDFIMKLPQGYRTVVGERGNRYKFSGGEKQRLSIARTFLKEPRILIFDEATSAIDNESSFAIQNSLRKLMQNKTTFIIAHRLTTVVNAQLILVMDNGRIVQKGTHKTLMEEEGVYRNLYLKEFN